ncbi:MAG: lipid IV(A) 3-deoxy-D-manno-octulosonic acid transferase [Gammaproteobacteria bacterium]|jgi:3-deoxy-D-manno-octulosonic-acid transferase|nr:lipid IV(A) 3-deoxy-D-manno-octulosonic acid transferase [Gammaproteobacteria bacterium]MDP7271109.1 lipid IV(A) 3-deoxy-D-manno-octulosonic acid transferase [Gammaproteobacteria bacterium]HJP05359.1 lipid IV(A) 3-deoxy-D-manno-octulosonic acid transferase [Gammaproteobacteria bacterium]
MHIILRFFYICVSYLLVPIILLLLFRKGFGNPAYWQRIGERFGFLPDPAPRGAIWIHAVSVGEVQAAESLVKALLQSYPGQPLLLTTTTPTGSDRVKALFGDQVAHCYVPFDLVGSVKHFFDWCQPRLAIILETELWPNLYHECGNREIPLVLASARVSPKSVNRYRLLVSLFRKTLSHGIVIAAQTRADADRFLALGASTTRTHVTGNIKFDFELPQGVQQLGQEFRALQAAERPVWIAASTHTDEEEIVLAAHSKVCGQIPDALLILVPRHPERFHTVANLLDRQGVSYIRRSSGRTCDEHSAVILGDTMGELMMYYAAADVAFVGGSLVKIGGHNLLEPAALHLPMIIGPHNFNAQEIADQLREAGVAAVAEDADSLAVHVISLLNDPAERSRQGELGKEIIESSRGALGRLLDLVRPLLR